MQHTSQAQVERLHRDLKLTLILQFTGITTYGQSNLHTIIRYIAQL